MGTGAPLKATGVDCVLLSDKAPGVQVRVPVDWQRSPKKAMTECCIKNDKDISVYDGVSVYPLMQLDTTVARLVLHDALLFVYCDCFANSRKKLQLRALERCNPNEYATCVLRRLGLANVDVIYGPVLCFAINCEPDSDREPAPLTAHQFHRFIATHNMNH